MICRSKNIVYANVCQICKEEGKDTRYIGETGRSLGERAGEHWQQFTSGGEGSHILNHKNDLHPEDPPQMKF